MKKSSQGLLITSTLMLALAGCNNGVTNEGGAFGLQTDSSPGGIWLGLEIVEGEYLLDTVVLITQNGRLHALREDGAQSTGQAGARRGEITAAYTTVLPLGMTFDDGSSAGTGDFAGQIFGGVSIDGNFVFDTTAGTRSEGVLALDFDGNYNRTSSLAEISGLWVTPGLTLDISETGTIFGQETGTGCIINGNVSIIDPLYSVYDFEWQYSACEAPLDVFNDVTFSGIVAMFGAPEEPDEDPTGPDQLLGGVIGSVSGTDVAVAVQFDRQ